LEKLKEYGTASKRRLFDPKGWDQQAEIELLREVCRKDFWSFFLYAFGAGLNPRGSRWIEPSVHEPLARWFQHHVDDWFLKRSMVDDQGRHLGEQKHLAILVHREVGKTTLMTRAGQLWLHLRDPEFSSYTGSEKTELSMKMLEAMKAVLDGSDPHALWSRLYGNWATTSRKWTGKEIVHGGRKNTSRQDPSLGTFAVETSITGSHPDAIFYDDPISYERMVTDTNWLGTVNTQVTSLFPAIQSDALVVWVGTRYDDDDHFGVAFREEGVSSFNGTPTDSIATSEDGKWHVYFMAGRDKEGKPTTPKVWPERRLNDYQRRDPLRYASQIMNDPQLSEFNPITKEQIGQCIIEPDQVPWSALRYAIMCDTALWDGQSRVNKDETVFIVHGYPRNGSGDVYVIEGEGSPMWRAEDFGNRLVALCERYRRQGRKIFRITDEETMAGKKGAWALSLQNMFNDHNEPFPGGRLHEFKRHSEKKTARLVTAASFWVDGHVRIVKGAKGVDRLCEQMSKIGQYMVNPKLKIDWADAHSDAFHPDVYIGMRKNEPRRGGYMGGANPIRGEGVNPSDWDDGEEATWRHDNPRLPERML
jgi:hypothetical protein